LVIDKIKEHVLTTDNLTKLVDMINEEMDGLAIEYRQRLDNILDDIADVSRRLERLYDALETGKIQLADLAPHGFSNCRQHDWNWSRSFLTGMWSWQMQKL
jgi:t-SNARE complex subunit (syntaxin)